MSGRSLLDGFNILAESVKSQPDYFIRELIFRTRKEKKIYLREIAKELGISHVGLHYFEQGKYEIPVERAIAIGRALKIPDIEIYEALHKDLDAKIKLARQKLKK